MPDSADAPSQTNLPEVSVSELANAIKRTVERDFDRVRVRGELGRVLIAKSGHLYVEVKDENASISTVMWKTNVQQLKFKPEEGLEVVVEGKISTYPGRSQYQLIADRMAPAGVGALLAQLEKLKAKLQAEGLFAAERKKPIPFLPQTIGIVTSPTGAVIKDILHRLADRFPRRVLLWPVLVQGEYAAEQVAKAINGFNKLQGDLRPDVLIVARGGGSIEDLWAFNEEIVARAAAASVIPLISAVGHETDTTLIDFVSDRRAPTPSAAAEMAVPVRAELIERVGTLGARLGGSLSRGLERRRVDLRAAGARLPRPDNLLGLAQQRFDRAAEKLGRALMANERAAEGKLARVAARLRPEALTQDVARRRQRVDEVGHRLAEGLRRRVTDKGRALEGQGRLLETLSHRSVLQRGFALATRPDGTLVRAAAGLAEGDALRLRFADGEAAVTVGDGAGRRKKGDPPKQGSLF
jgi:exodeoxyribonuclease VII large subunit